MQRNVKKYVSIIMSLLIIFQNSNYSVEAIKNYNPRISMSFGQKIKYAFCALRDKIKKNPKKSAAIGSGVGAGIVLLLLLCIRPWKSKEINQDKQKETDNLRRDDVKSQQQAEKTFNVQAEVKPKSVPEFSHVPPESSGVEIKIEPEKVSEVPANSEPEMKQKLETKPMINEVDDTCEPDDEAYGYLPTLFNPQDSCDEETVNTNLEQKHKLNSEPTGKSEPEDYADCEGIKELFEGYPSLDTLNIVLPDRRGYVSDVTTINLAKSPSPKIDEELKLNKKLQIEIDQSVVDMISKFCKREKPYGCVAHIRQPQKVVDLVKFLAQIENKHCRPDDVTSLLEANATRCWQKLMGFADSKRVIKNEALIEFHRLAEECDFKNGVINMKRSRGTSDWGIFKTSILRSIAFVADPVNPNRKILSSKDKKV
ncbi:MAG: hypothetical protein Q4D57_02425 [Clostridia bacterium]|nr:hypothetical protein [Clostridia bacterium]